MSGRARLRVRRRMRVWGLVQGVFYRDTCRRQAQTLGVSGWVRNLPDGAVEAVFEGPPEAVDRMVAWCRKGPAQAQVAGIEVLAEPVEGLAGFAVTR